MVLFLWMKKWGVQAAPLHRRNSAFQSELASLSAVLLVASAVYVGCIVSPPSLMDDVDAVQAQIARNMLSTGDWTTARLDGVAYLEKAPLVYWIIALSYKIFGATDWAARIPIALSVIGLALLTTAMGIWAFGRRAGLYAGLVIGTCIGLFLFTRILIPDVMLTLAIALGMWGFLRAIDEEEPHPRLWTFASAASLGTGLLLKSLIACRLPDGCRYRLSVRSRDNCFRRSVEATASGEWHAYPATDRRALAHSGNDSQSTLFACTLIAGPGISRLPLVLLYQRAAAAFPEPAVSARLQHRAAAVFLGVPSDLAISHGACTSRRSRSSRSAR